MDDEALLFVIELDAMHRGVLQHWNTRVVSDAPHYSESLQHATEVHPFVPKFLVAQHVHEKEMNTETQQDFLPMTVSAHVVFVAAGPKTVICDGIAAVPQRLQQLLVMASP